jgi:hypothetical protein
MLSFGGSGGQARTQDQFTVQPARFEPSMRTCDLLEVNPLRNKRSNGTGGQHLEKLAKVLDEPGGVKRLHGVDRVKACPLPYSNETRHIQPRNPPTPGVLIELVSSLATPPTGVPFVILLLGWIGMATPDDHFLVLSTPTRQPGRMLSIQDHRRATPETSCRMKSTSQTTSQLTSLLKSIYQPTAFQIWRPQPADYFPAIPTGI